MPPTMPGTPATVSRNTMRRSHLHSFMRPGPYPVIRSKLLRIAVTAQSAVFS